MLRMLAIVTLSTAVSLAAAQAPLQPQTQSEPPPGGRGRGTAGRGAGATPVTALRSPEVHPDRTVTLRLRAPQATQVEVIGEVVRGAGARAMTQGDDGVWTATIGP